MSTPTNQPVGVLLMTYGSATTSSDVPSFMGSVYGSKPPDPAVISEFERRFNLIGSSPLVKITIAQAQALQAELNSRHGSSSYVVEAGMLHSAPTIDTAVTKLAQSHCSTVKGLLLSPQYSSIIMGSYNLKLAAAATKHNLEYSIAKPWPTQAKFIKLLSMQLITCRQALAGNYGHNIPVIFTTHSLPESVVKKDPSYLNQLRATIHAIVHKTGLTNSEWVAAYQSAGHTPEAWLKPDLEDVLAVYAHQNISGVLIVPIQFLADHLEILYDLDIAAQDQANKMGINYHRIQLPNTNQLFIQALADIVAKS